MTNTELLTLIENFRQEILERNRAVPKATSQEQTVAGNSLSNQQAKPPSNSGENKNYSMLGVNYSRTLARFQALADQDSPEGKKLRASLDNQREKIDASGAYSWEGENPVYHKVETRK